jgi:uncharacterized protein (DUF849 family)
MAARKSRKVIITCAVTGGIHTPTMSDALPCRPEDIARQAIDAADAGAAILHLHARDPETGAPTPDPDVFMRFLPVIKQSTAAGVHITTGGGLTMTVEERLKAPLMAKPEMCSLNMGSINFGLFPLADRYPDWKFDWEQPYLANTDDFIFRNTFRDIAASSNCWATTAPNSSMSATTSATSTTSPTSSTAARSSRRSSSRSSSASSVESVATCAPCCS